MSRFSLLIFAALVVTTPLATAEVSRNETVDHYRQAKHLLMEHVYNDPRNRRTIYCDCAFDADKEVDHSTCSIAEDINYRNRRSSVEFEHATPASYGNHFSCYREPKKKDGGKRPNNMSRRSYCADVDEGYARMEADAHNLFPSVGSINAIRAAKAYGMLVGEKRLYGQCDFEANRKYAEPRDEVRGDLARATLYMSDAYGIRLSRQRRQLLEAWSRLDPPDDWERARNRTIREYQGNGNHWIQR